MSLRRVVEWTLALAPTVVLVVYWAFTDRIGRVSMLEDDAFYYLGVARSIAEGHGSTFAGTIMTNGYHPLWLALLVPVTWLVRDVELLVLAVVLVHGVLWAGSVREMFKIGVAVGAWQTAAAGVAAYSLLAIMTGHLAFNGMESALVMYLLLVLIRLGLADRSAPGGRSDLLIGTVLALICLARLDAIFGAVPLALVLLLNGRPTRRDLLRRAVALGAPAAIGLAVYLGVNQAVFGTAMPVSGQTKALGAPGDNVDQMWSFLKAGRFDGRPLWLGTAGLVLVLIALITLRWRASRPLGRLMAMTLALVVGQVALTAYLVVSVSFMRTFSWYQYQLALFAFGATVLVTSWLLERTRAARLLCIGLAGLVVAGSVAEAVVRAREPRRDAVFAAVDWIDANVPPDAMIAMGDRAGYLGFLAERPLLHLEGLVADADYLRQVEHGEALERMNDEGVEYYIYNARPARPVDLDGRDCWRFLEPPYTFGPTFEVTTCMDDLEFLAADTDSEGAGLSIWRYRPELNPGD